MATSNRALSLADALVESIMTREVKKVQPTETLADCIKVMKDSNIGSILVVQNEKPVGIFTERDLIRKMADGRENLGRNIGECMSQPLVTISPFALVWNALSLMDSRRIRRLPVVNNGELVGIVSERDVLRLILMQETLLLESVAHYIPGAAREGLKGIIGTLQIEPPPARLEG